VLGSVAFTPVKSDMLGNVKVGPLPRHLPTNINEKNRKLEIDNSPLLPTPLHYKTSSSTS